MVVQNAPMQLVVPSAVPAAVMMAASTWMMNFQMSFFVSNIALDSFFNHELHELHELWLRTVSLFFRITRIPCCERHIENSFNSLNSFSRYAL